MLQPRSPVNATRVIPVLSAVVLGLALTGQPAAKRITVFVGPNVRDGFVDTDQGIKDTIRDVQPELRRGGRFTIAATPEAAKFSLIVVGRRVSGSNGGVAVPVGNLAVIAPVHRRAIDSIIRVGSYEKTLTSEDEKSDAWRGAAKQVVRDLTTWIEADGTALASRSR